MPMTYCEGCGKPEPKYTCGLDDQPMLAFCRTCYITHVRACHPQVLTKDALKMGRHEEKEKVNAGR